MKTRMQRTEEALQRHRRFAEQQSQQDMLARDLRDKYMWPGVPEEVSDRLFEYAWQEGHAEGAHRVEGIYEELKDLVNAAFRAGKAHG